MNEPAVTSATGIARTPLGGLPQRLVQDGFLDEGAMLDALAASRERKIHFVS